MNRALIAVLVASMAALAPQGAQAATPAAGLEQTLRSGFFADVNLGGFFTGGNGKTYNLDKSVSDGFGVSNAQLYLQLGIGYDIIKTSKPEDTFGLSIGIHFGLGASAARCYSTYVVSSNSCVNDPASKGDTGVSDNFTITMYGAEVVFKVHLVDRLWLRPRIEGGYAMFDSPPVLDDGKNGVMGGGYAGVGVGIEYATHMDHFSIGIDIGGRLIIGPNIPAFTFHPMIKYTF